jgi:periplasmic copper chaperone A
MMFAKSIAILATVLFSMAALASDTAVTISEPYAKPTAGKIGIAFFTATASKNDSITSVSSACCDAVEIHRSEKFNGIMSMRKISELKLSKNEAHRVQPDEANGEHMMLIGLKKPLSIGDEVSVTFTFAKAPSQTVSFPVRDARSDTSATDSSHH